MARSPKNKVFSYPLTIGLPHTNLNALAETQLMMYAGHFQWNSIAEVTGIPHSQLKTSEGAPVYATYSYIETHFPLRRPLNRFQLDQSLIFMNTLRHFKGLSIDGLMVFDETSQLSGKVQQAFTKDPESLRKNHPYLRLCNVFTSRARGNEFLKIAPLADCSIESLPEIPAEENTYALCRGAARELSFGLMDRTWKSMDKKPHFQFEYRISPERDTNGAGLIYFANYIAFLDMAERSAMLKNARRTFTPSEINFRTLLRRRIAYYGNADIDDVLQISVSQFAKSRTLWGFRYRVHRQSDGKMIAFSEAIKKIA